MPDDLKPFPDDWSSALCIAAHPDDLEYGTASAVAAWTAAGKTVSYLLVTSGEAGIDSLDPAECGPIREAEERAGAAEVGVSDVEFLHYPDGVVEYGLPLRRDIAAVIRRRRPGSGGDQQPRSAAGLGRAGLRRSPSGRPGRGGCQPGMPATAGCFASSGRVGGSQPWKVRYTAIANSAKPTHAVDVTDTIDRGVASLRAHRRYLEGLGDPRPTRTRCCWGSPGCRASGSAAGSPSATSCCEHRSDG